MLRLHEILLRLQGGVTHECAETGSADTDLGWRQHVNEALQVGDSRVALLQQGFERPGGCDSGTLLLLQLTRVPASSSGYFDGAGVSSLGQPVLDT